MNEKNQMQKRLRSASRHTLISDNSTPFERNDDTVSTSSMITRKRKVGEKTLPKHNARNGSMDSSNQRITGTCQMYNQINHESSRFQPIVKVTPLKKNEIEEFLKSKNHSNRIKFVSDGQQFNHDSSRFQPIIKITPLKNGETNEFLNSRNSNIENIVTGTQKQNCTKQGKSTEPQNMMNAGEKYTSHGTFTQVSPIHFDRDEPLIREMSPETANESFTKVKIILPLFSFRIKSYILLFIHFQRILEIKALKSTPKTDAKRKRFHPKKAPTKDQLEYAETLERLQKKTKKSKIPSARKLYNPGHSFEETIEKENSDQFELKTEKRQTRSKSHK